MCGSVYCVARLPAARRGALEEEMKRSSSEHLSRRKILIAGGALVAVTAALPNRRAAADLSEMQAWRQSILGERTAEEGRIVIDLPEIAENGNTVPLAIEVDSPMTEKEHVKAVHVISTANPQPAVVTFRFTLLSGKASAGSRMRLAQTQEVMDYLTVDGRKVTLEEALGDGEGD